MVTVVARVQASEPFFEKCVYLPWFSGSSETEAKLELTSSSAANMARQY